ncbi:MAG: nitrilase-related carbon-nitrogen hydrolase, partial [Dehalococcoidia bacterium]|nr:nitrilase-related carbon-nitrogen hydrolase [Dehalococcoidia bacterium]
MRPLRLGLAQINPAVGDLAGNTRKIIEVIDSARGNQVDLLAFPELAITGYPPEDLLLKHRFIKDNIECLHKIVESSRSMGVIVGFVDAGSDLYNSAGVIWDGKLTGVYHKTFLPNYGVFDENRYFVEGDEWPVYVICGAKIGVNICEDIWYPAGPISAQVNAGAELIVNINASPFHAGKCDSRHKMVSTRASDHTAIVAYVNLVGGQDELVFDGGSMVYDEQGKLLAEGKNFEEDLVIVDLNLDNVFRSRLHAPRLRKERFFHQNDSIKSPEIEVSRASLFPSKQPVTPQPAQKHDMTGEVYSALVMGTRDYVRKNGFDRVVIGLSGGIDSSLVAVIAVDALGRDKVTGVAMPSPFTSDASNSDAARLAENLGIP